MDNKIYLDVDKLYIEIHEKCETVMSWINTLTVKEPDTPLIIGDKYIIFKYYVLTKILDEHNTLNIHDILDFYKDYCSFFRFSYNYDDDFGLWSKILRNNEMTFTEKIHKYVDCHHVKQNQ